MQPELRVFILERSLINPVPVETTTAAPLSGGLAAIFLPKLIELAIGSVATMLKKAGADKTEHATGRAFTNLFVADKSQALGPNRENGCVLGVYGIFSDEDGEKTDANDTALLALEHANLVPKNADIQIIFEAEVTLSRDRTAFFLDTRHFSVRDFIGDGHRSERGFVVTLGVTSAGATAEGNTIAIGNVDFGTLERHADVIPQGRPPDGYPQYRSNLMPWGQISSYSKAAYDADVAAGQAADKLYMPVTFGLTISQTEKGHPLLVKLGELLEGAKAEAATEIGKLILPEERAKADAERAAAAEKLYDDELAAELDVRTAQKAYDDGVPKDKPTLRVKLEQAIRKRDRATRLRKAAGLPDRDPVPKN